VFLTVARAAIAGLIALACCSSSGRSGRNETISFRSPSSRLASSSVSRC
jgi:hypothetical protein